MPISINTNIPSLSADRPLNSAANRVKENFEKLSSGKRINRASDDPAGLAIAIGLLTTANTNVVAARNISDGVSAANIAESAIGSASDITVRLNELATQSANGTLSDDQRTALNDEYQQLSSELDRISQTTEFNGQQLLSSSSSISIQAGTSGDPNSQIALTLPGVSTSSLGISGDISTQAGARAALDETRSAVTSLSSARGEIGSVVSRLETAFQNVKTEEINQRDAASRIIDTDVAKNVAELIAGRIQQQAAVSVKSQANTLPALALQLLG